MGRVRRKKSQTYSAKAHLGRARTAERCQESGDQSEDRNTANDRTRKRNRRLRRGRKPYATTHSNAGWTGAKGMGKLLSPHGRGWRSARKCFKILYTLPGKVYSLASACPGRKPCCAVGNETAEKVLDNADVWSVFVASQWLRKKGLPPFTRVHGERDKQCVKRACAGCQRKAGSQDANKEQQI